MPWLYLGSVEHASSSARLQALGVTALLNVSLAQLTPVPGFVYMNIPVSDNCASDLATWFTEAIQFIGEYCILSFCQECGKIKKKTQSKRPKGKKMGAMFLCLKQTFRIEPVLPGIANANANFFCPCSSRWVLSSYISSGDFLCAITGSMPHDLPTQEAKFVNVTDSNMSRFGKF